MASKFLYRLAFLTPLSIFCFLAIAQQAPNILVIIADDFGTDYCGFYENAGDTAKMPHVRSLLAKGVRFQNAWGTPYCSPSRACLMTGRYPFRTGVGTVIGGANSPSLDTAEMSLAKMLRNHAPTRYATAHIGKWHMNPSSPQALLYPTRVFGYDYFAGNFLGVINDYNNWTKIVNGVSRTVTKYATTETVNDAITWLDTVNNRTPFFMWLAFNAPHSPFHKPPDSLHTVQGLTGTTAHINQNPKLYFKAMTEAMDTEIGRLFRYLASIGRLENTQIIFIGDNGNAAQTAQLAADANRVKGTLYEGGIRVPLIIAGSQVVQPNRVSAALTGTVDLYATILEMAGFQNWLDYIPSVKKPVDAKSLMSVLKNQNTGSRTWTFSEQFSAASQAVEGKTIRNAVFKLIRFDNGQQAFYNLMTDPTERTNLLSRNLSSLERENYTFLCNELSLLVGTNRCLNVPTSDLADLGVKVSPTLFSESLFVETPDVFDYQLMDISGKVQLSGRRQGRTKISTQALPIGTYLLTVKTHRGGGSVKVVKVVGY